MLKKVPDFALGILFILLYTMAWTPASQAYLIYIAFVPLFILMDRFIAKNTSSKIAVFKLFFLFLTASFILNYWISNAHIAGTILASLVQSILLLIPSHFYYRFTKRGYIKQGLLVFLLSTISLEYVQNLWDLSWPWFNLGHSLSTYPSIIQWYQYTGATGGSLWILIANLFVYSLFHIKTSKTTKTIFTTILITPLFFNSKINKSDNYINHIKVIVYQPNIDAYKEKFTSDFNQQVLNFTKILTEIDHTETTLIVCPETFIHRSVKEDDIDNNPHIKLIQSALKSENHFVVTGANSVRKVDPKNEREKGSIRYQNGIYYKVFNSAILFSKNKTIDIYNKSKLVAGAETTPFSSILSPIVGTLFNIDLGGVSGNLGKSDHPKVLTNGAFSFSPIICFESAFGDYTAEFSEIGSDFITIITNDDWWGNTSGHKHHFELAKIRAIENQKYVVRSANTGISGIIKPNGSIVKRLDYKAQGIIEEYIQLRPEKTYYVQNKHLIAKLCTFVLIMLLLQMETLFIRTK